MVRSPSWRRLRERRAARKAARRDSRQQQAALRRPRWWTARRAAASRRRVDRREHRRNHPRWYRRAVGVVLAPEHRPRVGWAALGVVTLSLYWIAFGTAPSAYDMDQIGWGTAPFVAAAATLPLLLAPRAALTGWVASAVAALGLSVVLPTADLPDGTGSPWPWLVVHTLVLLTLLAAVAYRSSLLVVVLTWSATTLLLAAMVDPDLSGGWVTATTTVAAAGWLAGRLARSRQALRHESRMRSQEESARVLLEERARIARDLHDIVAHRMSLIAVQAETARYRRPGLPDEAVEELAQISATAREALAETRSLLGVLRNDDDPVATAPQPGVEDLRELVQGARRAGLPLEAEIDCPVDGLGASTSLTAYRVAQEALSNVARHAPGAGAHLEVRRADDHVRVRVTNTAPTGPPGARVPGAAHGLTGMRERVAAAGGTLAVGPTADGGFEVLAVLPAPPLPPVVPAVPVDDTAPLAAIDPTEPVAAPVAEQTVPADPDREGALRESVRDEKVGP
jgi:signal transduction histidine kinase